MKHKTITETAQALGKSRQLIWQRIRMGQMKAVRMGPLWWVPVSEVERWKAKDKEVKEMEFAQIGTDWQQEAANPLTGEEEESARDYINSKLIKWEIALGDENINDYIMRAWDEYLSISQ